MEDPGLTRKAIEELMKDMHEYKERKYTPTERKKNPLGRPNKLFLGRTINSMMTHNKRQSDRNLQRCERKLKELDAKQRNHVKLHSSHEVISSDSYEESYRNKKFKQIKKKKRKIKKKKYESRSNSPSSTISNSTTNSNSSRKNPNIQSKNRRRIKEKRKNVKEEDYSQSFYADCNRESTMAYYVDPNMAYALMACSQMNHMMQQQELVLQKVDTAEIEENIEILTDLSLSCRSSSESSLNISLHSSSAEEDENGIITFKLSSDDEEKLSHISAITNKKSNEVNKEIIHMTCEYDKDSVHSHISLDSNDSQSSIIRLSSEIYSLSSSCTDSADENSKSFQDTKEINLI